MCVCRSQRKHKHFTTMTKFLGEKCFCVILISSQNIHVYSTVTLSEKKAECKCILWLYKPHKDLCKSAHGSFRLRTEDEAFGASPESRFLSLRTYLILQCVLYRT